MVGLENGHILYIKITLKLVNPRDLAGNAEKVEEVPRYNTFFFFSLQITVPGVSWAALLSLSQWVPGQGLMCDTDHWLSKVCLIQPSIFGGFHLLLVVAWSVSRVLCC